MKPGKKLSTYFSDFVNQNENENLSIYFTYKFEK